MDIQVLCQEKHHKMIESILNAHGHICVSDSAVVIIDQTLLYNYSDLSKFDLMIQFNPDQIHHLIQLLQTMSTTTINQQLLGKDDDKYIPIQLENIVYIYACGNDTFLYTSNRNVLKIKYKLYQLEEFLSPNHFIRINKSEIINIAQIASISPMFRGNLVLHMNDYDHTLDISRNYLKDFKERLGIV